MSERGWGEKIHYYAHEASLEIQKLSREEQEIANRLEKRFPDLRGRVEKAFKDANGLIREHLRTETGLRLSTDESRQSVSVRVVDGVPLPLQRRLNFHPEIIDLYLDLPRYRDSAEGIKRLLGKYGFLETWPPIRTQLAGQAELVNSLATLERLIAEIKGTKFFEPIWDIDEDTLGAYFFRQNRIELYWVAIGLFAASLEVSPEALTQVAATHELAHAYTHLGFDIDNLPWPTERFAATSNYVVEGIAQFYTEAVCRRLERRLPDAYEAYARLLDKLHGPYKAHLGWLPPELAGGEVVRNALVTFRTNEVTSHEIFREMIGEYTDMLGARRKALQPLDFDEPVR